MNAREIKARLRSIQLQLKLLEAQIEKDEGPGLRFADLEGIWEGKTDFSFEEIQAAEYKVKDFPA